MSSRPQTFQGREGLWKVFSKRASSEGEDREGLWQVSKIASCGGEGQVGLEPMEAERAYRGPRGTRGLMEDEEALVDKRRSRRNC